MKTLFTLEVMFGDGDEYRTLQAISDNQAEIDFMTCFLKNYNTGLYRFYERANYVEKSPGRKKNIISILNKLVKLFNNIDSEDEFSLLEDDCDYSSMETVLHEILFFVDEYFGGEVLHCREDYYGYPVSYKIEEVPDDITEITKEEAIKLLKDKLGMNVIII